MGKKDVPEAEDINLDRPLAFAEAEAGGEDTSNVPLQTTMERMDEEAMEICQRKGLSPYIKTLDNMIYETYQGVDFIEHSLLKDPDTPEHEQLCFEIHITGEPDKIIGDQREFYLAFIKQVPREKRHFFTFTYRVS